MKPLTAKFLLSLLLGCGAITLLASCASTEPQPKYPPGSRNISGHAWTKMEDWEGSGQFGGSMPQSR
ncbi:MAG: hypothetical protein R3F11_22665 [Verrucomicrobiales bacterium]